MSGVLGFIFMSARVTETTRQNRVAQINMPDQQNRVLLGPIDLETRYAELLATVKTLREENGTLTNSLASQTGVGKVLNDQLEETKMFACLTEVEGPGVEITLRDGGKSDDNPNIDKTIHDADVLSVVNELWLSGAEAISVNDIRLSPRSTIRCIGPVIEIDTRRVATPIYVRAIGDPKVLAPGLQNLPGGIIETLQATDPNMALVETADYLKLPAYDGSTDFKFGRVPKAKK